MRNPPRRIAIVHDFLYCYGGAERVLEQMIEVFPAADLFSLFDFLPAAQRGFLQNKPVRTTFIQNLPLARTRHRSYLPLMPLAIEQLNLSEYDMVLSSSYLAAKGVILRPDQLHVCYCHSPIRFAWDLQHQYLAEAHLTKGLRSLMVRALLHYIRSWDARSANGVDQFIANSQFVSRRISKAYRRKSTPIYPPVDVDWFIPAGEKQEFYLTASRLVPYKRIELIVDAFRHMPQRKLIVLGDGPEFSRIRSRASSNVTLMGHQSGEVLRSHMQAARAFVFAAEEDFGIVTVEAQACGTPVIAFGRGGSIETVVEGVTGLFFREQTAEAIIDAVERFESTGMGRWNSQAIRSHAEQFNAARFREEFRTFVEAQFTRFRKSASSTPAYLAPGLETAELAWEGRAKTSARVPLDEFEARPVDFLNV
jgi:glycosyltransferase involved in cell wall biosynthesis